MQVLWGVETGKYATLYRMEKTLLVVVVLLHVRVTSCTRYHAHAERRVTHNHHLPKCSSKFHTGMLQDTNNTFVYV